MLQPHEAPQAYEWPEEPRVAATNLIYGSRPSPFCLLNKEPFLFLYMLKTL
jgi:hypothetical protein